MRVGYSISTDHSSTTKEGLQVAGVLS